MPHGAGLPVFSAVRRKFEKRGFVRTMWRRIVLQHARSRLGRAAKRSLWRHLLKWCRPDMKQTMPAQRPALSHLDRLEAEAIHIFREVAATFARPVMLYSVGKDSSVLLHLAMKAFYPAK